MRSGLVRRTGRGSKRYLSADLHVFAVRVRLYGRIRRNNRGKSGQVRRKGRARVFRNADLPVADNFGYINRFVCRNSSVYAAPYKRHARQRRGLFGGLRLLPYHFSRNSGAGGLQFRVRSTARVRRFGNAARISDYFHRAQRGAGHSVSRSARNGTCGSRDRNGAGSAYKFCRLPYLHAHKIRKTAYPQRGLARFRKGYCRALKAGRAARTAILGACRGYNRHAGRACQVRYRRGRCYGTGNAGAERVRSGNQA